MSVLQKIRFKVLHFVSKMSKQKKCFRDDRRPLFAKEYQDSIGIYHGQPTFKELYSNINAASNRTELLKYQHNSQLWLHWFDTAVKGIQSNHDKYNSRMILYGLRILIARQTLMALNNGTYITDADKVVEIKRKDLVRMAKETYNYRESDIVGIERMDMKSNDDFGEWNTKVFAINEDCIDVGHRLLGYGYKPCVLNMAGHHCIGGGWEHGCGAQEECLFRRTSYIASMGNTLSNFNKKCYLDITRKWKYRIHEFGCIYSHNILVFRSNEKNGYKYLDKPFYIDFIAAAMYKRPQIDKYNNYMDMNTINNIKKKMRSLLRVCYMNGNDCIVLSAWGCGAFKNPPKHQSQIWKSVLNENEFKNVFKIIAFAIFDDHNSKKKHNPNGNFKPFADTFGEHDCVKDPCLSK